MGVGGQRGEIRKLIICQTLLQIEVPVDLKLCFSFRCWICCNYTEREDNSDQKFSFEVDGIVLFI